MYGQDQEEKNQSDLPRFRLRVKGNNWSLVEVCAAILAEVLTQSYNNNEGKEQHSGIE